MQAIAADQRPCNGNRSRQPGHKTRICCGGRDAISAATLRPARDGPSRRHLAQRLQHEGPFMGARMRQDRVRARRATSPIAMISRSSVRAALRLAARRPARASIACSAASRSAGSGAIAPTDSRATAIDIVGLVGGRDRRGRVPARHRVQTAGPAAPPALGHRPAAGLQRRFAVRARQVGADGDQNHDRLSWADCIASENDPRDAYMTLPPDTSVCPGRRSLDPSYCVPKGPSDAFPAQ